MTKTSKTVVFFGNERLATGVSTTAPTLKGLIERGYEVAAVVVNQDEYKSRQQSDQVVEELAKKHKILLLKPKRLDEIINQLSALQAEIGILAAYGRIIPARLIDVFPLGIINIHPSLLPLGRGPIPIEQAILEGAKLTGVSIMQLVEAMDAGPIYTQQEVPLSGSETKQELANKLLSIGSNLLFKQLPNILAGTTHPTSQDESKASYNKLISKQDGNLDWNKSADELEREIRAYRVWPKSRTTLSETQTIIIEAVVNQELDLRPGEVRSIKGRLFIGCSEDSLEIKSLQPLNKAEMTTSAFLAGHRIN